MKTTSTTTTKEVGTGANKTTLTKTVRESTLTIEILDLDDNLVQLTIDRVSFALLQESLDRFNFLAGLPTDERLRSANIAFKNYIKNNSHSELQVEAMSYFGEVCHAIAASTELFEPLSDTIRRHAES